MALTNFAALTTEEKTVWSRDLWMAARNASFTFKFAGRGPNAMIQRITELTRSEKGARAVITLIADLTGDGVMGDTKLEDAEEAIKAFDTVVQIDQLRNGNRLAGRYADQRSIVNFRETSRDVLAYWIADRIDQLSFLTLSGISYLQKNTGEARPVLAAGLNLDDLTFGADITSPTAGRHQNWDGTDLVTGDTTADNHATISYKMLVKAKAFAKDAYVRGIKGPDNSEFYHIFMTPRGLADLKLDADFLANLRNAGIRGTSNPLFTGAMITQDGLAIHEFRHVYNTSGLAAASKWGSAGNTDGQRVLMCGAQCLAMADIGLPYWDEDEFDYANQIGISVGKLFGLIKPVLNSIYAGGDEDFGVIAIDTLY